MSMFSKTPQYGFDPNEHCNTINPPENFLQVILDITENIVHEREKVSNEDSRTLLLKQLANQTKFTGEEEDQKALISAVFTTKLLDFENNVQGSPVVSNVRTIKYSNERKALRATIKYTRGNDDEEYNAEIEVAIPKEPPDKDLGL